MPVAVLTWTFVASLSWSVGALSCVLTASWLWVRRDRFGPARTPLVAALAATAAWALAGAWWGSDSGFAALSEAPRNLCWLFALYRLFAIDGRHESLSPVRPMLAAVGFVEALQGTAKAKIALQVTAAQVGLFGFHTFVMLHLLALIGALVLVHNLYGGASPQARLVLRWPALALTALWGFDLNYYVIAVLSGGTPDVLAALRGGLGLVCGGLLAFGARRGSDDLRFRPSHEVTFQSVSLMVIGGYLLAMVVIAQWLAVVGGDLARLLQLGFVALAALVALTVLPSRRMRGWLRVTLSKHLFQHRYDYRAEWLRFTRTMGQAGNDAASLEERAIRALADITDSSGGLLLTMGDDGAFGMAARWQWPTADVPPCALAAAAAHEFESTAYVADLDAIRSGRAQHHVAGLVPAWLLSEPRAWAMVPLLHYDRLVAMIVLARPAHVRELDWEDFDLMRVVGRQLASYLAEHSGQEALAEAGRFDDFHRRIAFVMHDIKNLASQLSLLARNAEQHAENPEFRADMLVTLRNSADKLNAMLARLSRYGPASVAAIGSVRADEVAMAIVAQFRGQHPVALVEAQPCEVAADRESLEQVLLHLVQNAVDASAPDAPVFVRVAADHLSGVIEVVDSGTGMSTEFIRSRLFRPFDSTKSGGFGIGAYEARELVRAMRGRLDVESREGMGARFIISLPRAEAAELFNTFATGGADPGKKVA